MNQTRSPYRLDQKRFCNSSAAIKSLLDEGHRNATKLAPITVPVGEDQLDDLRHALLPYILPPTCRIEVLADLQRAVADCRRNFLLAPCPVTAVFKHMLSVCPDATAQELDAAIVATIIELGDKIVRICGWKQDVVGAAPEIEMWLELARGRLAYLDDARGNVEKFAAPAVRRRFGARITRSR